MQRFRRGQQLVRVRRRLEAGRVEQVGAPPGQLGVGLDRDAVALALPDGGVPVGLRKIVNIQHGRIALDQVIQWAQGLGADHFAEP